MLTDSAKTLLKTNKWISNTHSIELTRSTPWNELEFVPKIVGIQYYDDLSEVKQHSPGQLFFLHHLDDLVIGKFLRPKLSRVRECV
jgi:hypothetical protein